MQKGGKPVFEIGKLVRLDLGRRGENKARTIEIDMTAWLEEFPGSSVGVMIKRPDETTFYPAALDRDGNIIRWTITRADVDKVGIGEAQIILSNTDDVELRSRVVPTKIEDSMSGTVGSAPSTYSNFVNQVIQAADRAEAAVDKMPSISANGTWNVWDPVSGTYKDSGKPTRGPQGAAGGYYVPNVSSSGLLVFSPSQSTMPTVPAVNVRGPKGDDGTHVTIKSLSESAEAGGTSTIVFSDGQSLQVKNGTNGTNGTNGYTPIKGKDYFDGAPGYTPVKGKDYWTAADQQAVVNDVLNALPVYNGEVTDA